jgi:hypothetical protein
MHRFGCGASVAVVILALGCGDKPRSRVFGKVTYQNKPLARAVITFFGSDNMTYVAESKDDGTYEVAGVPRGQVRVSLHVPGKPPRPRPDPVPGKSSDPARAEDNAKGRQPPPAAPSASGSIILPTKYSSPDTSELSFELTAADQEYKIDLK